MVIVDTFGARLQWALDQRSWKPVKIAAELETDPDTPKRWVANLNKPKFEQIAPLADLLGVDVRWLLTGDGEPYAQPAAAGGEPPRPGEEPADQAATLAARERRRKGSTGRSK